MNFGERDRRGVDRPQEIGVDRFAGMVDDELGGVAQICQKLTALIENPRLCSPKFLTCEQRSV